MKTCSTLPDQARHALQTPLPARLRRRCRVGLVKEKKVIPYVDWRGHVRECLKHALCTVHWSSVSTLYPKSLKNKLTP